MSIMPTRLHPAQRRRSQSARSKRIWHQARQRGWSGVVTFDPSFHVDQMAPSTTVSSHQGCAQKGVLSVLAIEIRCAISTLALLARGKLAQPNDLVGSNIEFADGSVSRIYRETCMLGLETAPHVMLAVRFRLRFIGSSRLGHALFRFESLFNTLLFGAHRGFYSKLWITDRTTDYYRGIYEWEDEKSAIEYAETLRIVLAPWVQRGSFAYRIMNGVSRPDFLEGRLPFPLHEDDRWCSPVRARVDTHPLDGV